MNFLQKTKEQLDKAARLLAKPTVLFFTLPWLMFLLVAGTIAQRSMGLYEAQKMFFSSFILWLGPVPLPGMYLTLGVVLVCLLVKFLYDSKWSWNQAGIILTHLGVLILLIGGVIAVLGSRDGFMIIPEKASSSEISSYYDREFVIRQDDQVLYTFPFEKLKAGNTPSLPLLPLEMRIIDVFENAKPEPVEDTSGRVGIAQQMKIVAIPKFKKEELNRGGITFEISGTDTHGDGKYVMMEDLAEKIVFELNNKRFSFEFGRKKMPLPFSVKLEDFERKLHPGTQMASGFQSIVLIEDGITKWPAFIRMNQPLRYKGYTFYQSSFIRTPQIEKTVLNVVYNKGRVFPYIAAAIILLGLLLHVAIRLMGKGASKKD